MHIRTSKGVEFEGVILVDTNGNPVAQAATAAPTGPDPNTLFSYSYNADGTLATEQAVDANGTWNRTYSYTSGNLTGMSAWTKS